MSSYELRLSVPKNVPTARSKEIFYWSPNHRGSIVTTLNGKKLGPKLRLVGPVPRPNIDFVRLATTVFAADRSSPRSGQGTNWSCRDFDLKVPVFDPDAWNAIAQRLAPLLGFLTGDRWSLRFVRSRSSPETGPRHLAGIERVVLLSGGADSACGALMSRHELGNASQVFVSHVGATALSPFQQNTANAIKSLLPGGKIHHRQYGIRRRSTQVNGIKYKSDYSNRSRSFLFLSLGLAEASLYQAELWIPENGFASLNPPLGAERRGSLSTRTTHPTFLSELPKVLKAAGVHSSLRNPCERMTKAEMFSRVADLIGPDRTSEFLSATHSCAHTGQRTHGISVGTQCGVCFGCAVRQSAFVASGITDLTQYLQPTTPKLQHFLNNKSAGRAIRDFIRRGISERDIAAMILPSRYPPAEALDLCNRAIKELRTRSL